MSFISRLLLLLLFSPTLGAQAPLAASYFDTGEIPELDTTGTAASLTTFIVNLNCQTLQLQVTDPEDNPLPASTPYTIRVLDEAGDSITDVTGNVSVTMRVYTAEAVTFGALFRSGEGASDSRTALLTYEVPGSTTEWTEFTLTFEGDDLGGFDATDLRDFWFYLDPDEENFAGNQFVIDHIVFGGAPDTERYSPCDLISSTQEPAWGKDLSLYPNPVTEEVTLEFAGLPNYPANLTIALFDAVGRRTSLSFATLKEGQTRLPAGGLSAGTYFIVLTDPAGGRVVRSFIKR